MSATGRWFLEQQQQREQQEEQERAEREHNELMYLRERTTCKSITTEKK
jgi:hypothetical protein